jgi:hypothetical protein
LHTNKDPHHPNFLDDVGLDAQLSEILLLLLQHKLPLFQTGDLELMLRATNQKISLIHHLHFAQTLTLASSLHFNTS